MPLTDPKFRKKPGEPLGTDHSAFVAIGTDPPTGESRYTATCFFCHWSGDRVAELACAEQQRDEHNKLRAS